LNWATLREPRPERRRDRSRSNDNSHRRRTNERVPSSGSGFTAYVGNLSFKTRERSIEEFFEECGKINSVRIAKSQDGKVYFNFDYLEQRILPCRF
jgi:RNA recognition motif-containing protein